jgi:hypothetical protein
MTITITTALSLLAEKRNLSANQIGMLRAMLAAKSVSDPNEVTCIGRKALQAVVTTRARNPRELLNILFAIIGNTGAKSSDKEDTFILLNSYEWDQENDLFKYELSRDFLHWMRTRSREAQIPVF